MLSTARLRKLANLLSLSCRVWYKFYVKGDRTTFIHDDATLRQHMEREVRRAKDPERLQKTRAIGESFVKNLLWYVVRPSPVRV